MTSSKRSTRLVFLLVGLAVLACMVTGLVFGYRYFRRGQDYMGRPLVLIDSPAAGERLTLGQGVPALAQARSESGITRIELWAEGALLTAEEAPAGETYSPMTLSATWAPTTLGEHTLTARAFAARGLAGYASVNVEVVPEDAAPGISATTQGESIDTIGADSGAGVDESAEPSAGLPGDGTVEGGEPTEPLGDLPSNEPTEPEPSAGRVPLEMLGGVVELPRLVTLRLEAIGLETRAGYESLHCYSSLGDQQPVWYPDADNDPATDESFAPLSAGEWDIAAHFAGNAAPLVAWPGNQALPFDISCVGVRSGGADAVKLGRLALSIPPSEWDGERRRARAEDEGEFILEYILSFVEMEPKGLDMSMAVPQLRYDDRRQSLRWDYTPRTEPEAETEIDGFLVFLNDNLVFEMDADERESRLPEAWLAPPCGESYGFTVRAFHRPYPDGAYSEPSNTVSIAGPEEGSEACNRQFIVTFRRLNVYNMGDDGDDDASLMGPINGWVDVNYTFHSFGNPPSVSIYNDSSFNMDTFFWDDYSEANTFAVTLAEGDDLHLGFHMADNDRRRHYDRDICTGGETLHYSELLTRPVEGSFDARREWEELVRCNIEYSIEPAPGSPVGVAGGGLLLPWLDLTDVTLDRATGELQLHITNTGSAAWANQDLDVQVTNRDGQETGTHSWPLFYLDPLEDVVLQDPSLTADSPEAACVHLDYNDRVLESLEYTGVLHHGRLCPSLPDLIIEDVQYERDDAQLQVTVRNLGDGAVEDRAVSVDLLAPDGSPITPPLRPTVALLEYMQSTVLTWPSIDPDLRETMLQGYTVRLNGEGRLLEEDLGNNDYAVPVGETVWVVFRESMVTVFYRDWIPWWADYPVHHFVVSFSVTVAGGESSQQVGHWSQDFDWEPTTDDDRYREVCDDCYTEQVAVGGDEQFLVGAAASVRKQASATREDLGSWSAPIDIQDPDQSYARYYGTQCLWGQEGHTEAVVEGVDRYAGEYVLPRDWGVSYCVFRLRE